MYLIIELEKYIKFFILNNDLNRIFIKIKKN